MSDGKRNDFHPNHVDKFGYRPKGITSSHGLSPRIKCKESHMWVLAMTPRLSSLLDAVFLLPECPRLPSGCRCNNLKSHNKATYCLRRWRCPRGSNNNYFSLDLAGDVARIEFQRLSATANVQVKCIRHWFHSAKPYLRSKCTASIWSFFFLSLPYSC